MTIYYLDRFWSKVDRRGPDECWPWMATRNAHGYGQFWTKEAGKKIGAHRVAFLIAGGELRPGECVMHSCDYPPCVNPRHLSAGTMADNNRDKKEKGRSNRGERHGHAKLTEDDVVVIRGEYAGGRMTQAEIAARYGVAPSQVSMVVNRRTWGHVA